MKKNRMRCQSCNGTHKIQLQKEVFTSYGSYISKGDIIDCPDCEDGTWDKMKYVRSWIGFKKELKKEYGDLVN